MMPHKIVEIILSSTQPQQHINKIEHCHIIYSLFGYLVTTLIF